MDAETTTPFSKQQSGASNPFIKKENERRRLHIVLYVLGGLVIFGLVFLFAWLGSRAGILILEPSKDFTVTLNGDQTTLQTQKDGIFIHTSPGLYRLELSRPGFAPFDANVNIGRGQIVRIRPIYSILPKKVQESGDSIAFVRASLDQKYIFYLDLTQKTIYQIDIANQTQAPITLDPLNNVTDVEWSDNPDLALIVQPDGTYLQEIPIYNFSSQIKSQIAGPEVSSPVWDPNDEDRIAFYYHPSDGEHSLVFSDIHLSLLDRKADISSIPNPKLVWAPNSNYILLVEQGGNPAGNNLWIYDTIDGNLKQLTTTGNITDATFSPDSATIIYNQGEDLETIKPDGTDAHDLKLNGQVAQVAWRDNSSFYLPDNTASLIHLVQLAGSQQSIPFSFPSSAIQGMHYFPESQTLIFYTSTSIYLADLSK